MTAHLLTPGTQLGRYEVVAHLATGGMGEVYRACDVDLGRQVALKVLRARLADSPAAVERFRREARAAARLAHKNIVTLHDWGMDNGIYFLALEFVEGSDLYSHINGRGRLAPLEAWNITRQAVRALDHAFGQGITHRDIKPANILLTRSGRKLRVKLTDFGLALRDDEDFRVTRDGSTVGTIDYLAPEQARDSSSADVRSDIYSLGCTLYHMLAGHPPFPEGGVGERVYRHQQVEPPDVRQFNGDVPSGLWEVLRRMLAKRPDDRFQTPADLYDALLRLTTGERRPKEPADEAGESVVATASASPFPPHTQAPDCTPSEILALGGARRRTDPALPSLGLADLAARANLKAARQAGDHRKVLQCGEEILARSPGDVETRLDMVDAAAALGLPDLEASLLEQASLLNPESPESFRRLALAHERRKEPGKAIGAWRAVRKLRPDDAEAPLKIDALLRQMARAYERQDDREKALLVWEAVRKARPDDPEAAGRIDSLSVGK
jgi:hypothetical protein